MNIGDLTFEESHRMWNVISPRKPRYSPVAWDWDQWEERWCLGFDASRHAIPYQTPLPFPGHDIDALGHHFPDLPEWQMLDSLEFEMFERCFFTNPIEASNEIMGLLRMNYAAYAAVYEQIQIKLASVFEQE